MGETALCVKEKQIFQPSDLAGGTIITDGWTQTRQRTICGDSVCKTVSLEKRTSGLRCCPAPNILEVSPEAIGGLSGYILPQLPAKSVSFTIIIG